MTDFLVSMVAGAAGAALFIAGFRWRPPLPPKDGLPCPHAMCLNTLPRLGSWSHAQNEWAVETCLVCGGSVQFRGFNERSSILHPQDTYIRVHVPEVKP